MLPPWLQHLLSWSQSRGDVAGLNADRRPPELWSPEASAARIVAPASAVVSPDALPAAPRQRSLEHRIMHGPLVPSAEGTQSPLGSRIENFSTAKPPTIDDVITGLTGIRKGLGPNPTWEDRGWQALNLGLMFAPEMLHGLRGARGAAEAVPAVEAASHAPDWSVLSSPARGEAPAVGALNLEVPTFMREAYQAPRSTPDFANMDLPTFLRRGSNDPMAFTPPLEASAAAPGVMDAHASRLAQRMTEGVSPAAEATYQGLLDRRAQRMMPPDYVGPMRRAGDPGPYERTPFRAAIEMPDGQIISGRTHLEAVQKAEAGGFTGDLSDARDGFVRTTDPNTLLSRHETEQLMGFPRTTGGLGSEDLLGGTQRGALGLDERGMIGPLYHGSPHDFNQFDISKVGTGEGAAAYGHGLYFASAKDVGEFYRNQLAGQPEITHLRLGDLDVGPHNGFDYSPKGHTLEENIRSSLTEDLLIDQQNLTANGPKGVQKHALDLLDQRIEAYKTEWPEGVAPAQRLRKQLAKPGAVSMEMVEHPGKLYTVDVDAHPEQLLDWDAPLRKQPPQVQSIARAKLKELKYLGPRDNGPIQLTRAWKSYVMERGRGGQGDAGGTIYHGLLEGSHKGPEASALLHKAGIKGIRYLDANSRGAGATKTRNYVMFHHDPIKIRDKGSAALGMLAGTGAAAGGALTAAALSDQDTPGWVPALAGLGVAGALGARLSRAGRLGGAGEKLMAQGLLKEEAVARMKSLSDQGVRAQMRPEPNGFFSIIRKGEPGTALAKPAPKEIARIGPQGEAQSAGFQSRLLTTVDHGKWPEKGMTPDEWYQRLSNSPNVPKAELDAVLTPDVRDDLRAGAAGRGGRITADELSEHIANNSPVTRLEKTTLRADEGGHPKMTEADIDHETDYQVEAYAEMKHSDSQDAIRSRDQRLDLVRDHLRRIFGTEGGDRAFNKIVEPMLPEGADAWGNMTRRSWPFEHWSISDLKDYEPGMLDEVRDAVKALQHPDPTQMSLSSPVDPTIPAAMLERISNVHARAGIRGPELSDATINEIMGRLEHASDYQDEAVQHLLDADNPPYDMLREDAIRNLEENGDFGQGRDAGDTEFSSYQRVDESAPYREILIHDPELGTEGGHFGRGEIAHARGEIHDKTYLMIEAQSDVGQRANRASPVFRDERVKDSPFRPTDRWAQLGTGASLQEAAKEGLGRFAWVTPEDRMSRANLARQSAKNTYGSAVPDAVTRIFKWLDEPMQIEHVKLHGGTFPSVKLTPEMRAKILKAGVPALGIAAVAAMPSNAAAQGTPETTRLSPKAEPRFRAWVKRYNIRDLDHPDSHYDYRGAFLAGAKPDAKGHWPDTFKQHGHESFSVQSKYSRGAGDGGTWNGNTFVPSRRDSLARRIRGH